MHLMKEILDEALQRSLIHLLIPTEKNQFLSSNYTMQLMISMDISKVKIIGEPYIH